MAEPMKVSLGEAVNSYLLEACKNAMGAYDALKVFGISHRLPGYESCLADLNIAIEHGEALAKIQEKARAKSHQSFVAMTTPSSQ